MVYSSVEGLIDNIVEVVQKMFFFYVYDEDTINDLKQEGYLMAYELLAKGEYDPSRSLRNYLFTGVRNAMTNFMYKKNKTKKDISHDTLESAEFQDFMNVTGNDYYVGKVYTRIEYQIGSDITVEDLKEVTDKYKNYLHFVYTCSSKWFFRWFSSVLAASSLKGFLFTCDLMPPKRLK